MTMAFFWGCFGAAGAWRFSLEIQFLFFGALVVCWCMVCLVAMTIYGRRKAAREFKAEVAEEEAAIAASLRSNLFVHDGDRR